MNLEDPQKGMKPNEHIWIYKHTWMFCIYEIVDISLKQFTIMFKELTMTRFDLS
jgi:outer membrane lipoprotein-sorting protein